MSACRGGEQTLSEGGRGSCERDDYARQMVCSATLQYSTNATGTHSCGVHATGGWLSAGRSWEARKSTGCCRIDSIHRVIDNAQVGCSSSSLGGTGSGAVVGQRKRGLCNVRAGLDHTQRFA